MPTVALLGTLDTKGAEYAFLRDRLRELGVDALLVDAGAKAGSNTPIIPVGAGLTDLYAYRVALDVFHGVTVSGQPLVRTWLPDFTEAGAVKTGEVEMGPLAVALKATKAASVLRGVKVA